MFALTDHMEALFGDIHVRHDILPFVFFTNEELILGGNRDSAAFANEPNEGHVAL